MSRQAGIRTLVAAGLLVVAGVLGLAAKVGHDTSQYLQTVSTQRNWESPGQAPDVGAVASSPASPGSASGSESPVVAANGAVASR